MTRPVVIFSPLPPVPSGIASYTHTVAEALISLKYPVTVIVNQDRVSYSHGYEVRYWKELLYSSFLQDAAVFYQVGNNIFHDFIYPFLFSEPGILVLHDYLLGHGRLAGLMHVYSRKERHEELTYELGEEAGGHLSRIIEYGVHGHQLPFVARLNKAVLQASFHTIVHNPDTARIIKAQIPSLSVEHFPMAIWEDAPWEHVDDARRMHTRKRLAVDPHALVLGTFGVVNPYKQIDVLLEVQKELYEEGCNVYFLIVGYLSPDAKLRELVTDLGLLDCVRIMHNVATKDYWDFVRATDVCYSLRFPPAGEFSLSVLELMGAGRTVMINQHRFNSYLPENVCIKVSNSKQKEDLLHKTKELYENRDLLLAYGARAREFVRQNFSMNAMVEGYRKAIDSYDIHRQGWQDHRMELPWHLRPLTQRVYQQIAKGFGTFSCDEFMDELQRALS